MNSKEIIEAIKEDLEIHPKEAAKVLKAITQAICVSLSKNERVEMRGLGTFEIRKRKAKRARDINKGIPVLVQERKVVYFKPGHPLKQLLNS